MPTEEQVTIEAEALSIPELRAGLLSSSNYGVVEIQEADRSELEGMYINARMGRDPFRTR